MATISNPIPASQVVDVDIDFNCTTAPTCLDLNSVLQAFDDEFCTKQDVINVLTAITYGTCFTAPTGSLLALLQKMVTSLDTLECAAAVTGTDVDITNLNICSSDNWTCADLNQCLPLVDVCNNPITVYTIKEMFQMIIKRMMAYQDHICDLETNLAALTTAVGTLSGRVDNLESNPCC